MPVLNWKQAVLVFGACGMGLILPALPLSMPTPAVAQQPAAGAGGGQAPAARTNAGATASQARPMPPAVIGTIDMDAAFKGYEKVKNTSEEFKAAALAEQEKLTKLAATIKSEIEKLAKLDPNSPDYKRQETQITEFKAKHEAQRQQAERDFARREAESLAMLYREIQEMTARVAQFKGMNYVVKVSQEPVTGNDPNSVMAAMSRAVVYADPRADITQDVVFNLNHLYKSSGGAPAPAGNAAAPSAAAPGAGIPRVATPRTGPGGQ